MTNNIVIFINCIPHCRRYWMQPMKSAMALQKTWRGDVLDGQSNFGAGRLHALTVALGM
jgi:hypothetical protein